MVTAANGTVIAFAEGRVPKKTYGPWGDSHPMSIVCKRGSPQSDGRIDWSESILVEDRAEPHEWGSPERVRLMNPDRDASAWGNPTPVVDRVTGRVFLFYCVKWGTGGDRSEQFPARVFYRHSDDHGMTWAPRVDLTYLYKDNPWGMVCGLPALGHGIQLRSQQGANAAKNGRMIVPAWHLTYGADEERLSMLRRFAAQGAAEYSKPAIQRLGSLSDEWKGGESKALSLILSDDHGKTWRLGGTLCYGHECRAAELVNGRLLFSIRTDGGKKDRAIAVSDDGGESLRLTDDAVDLTTIRIPERGYLDQGLIRYAAKPEHAINCLIWSAPQTSVNGDWARKLNAPTTRSIGGD